MFRIIFLGFIYPILLESIDSKSKIDFSTFENKFLWALFEVGICDKNMKSNVVLKS